MKFSIIIDSYPQSQDQQVRLIENLKKLKKLGFDVLLTSHYPCPESIIEHTDYYLYEKSNNYFFLDSDILNQNICGVKDPVYLKYTQIADEIFYDRLVVTGWSVAITSQLFNAIKLLHGKGYEYSFYLVDDFICPDDFDRKIQSILKKSGDYRNYFIKNSPQFNSWFAGFFFGFTIDNNLISRIPNEDFSKNSVYQKYFPNCSGEDVVNRIWSNDLNYIEDHEELNNIFGKDNWNLVSSVIRPGSSQLHNDVLSSVHVNLDRKKDRYCLALYLPYDSLYEKAQFNLRFFGTDNTLLKEINLLLFRGHWYKEYLDSIFDNQDSILYQKEIIGYSEEEYSFVDNIIINKSTIDCYFRLKSFEVI